jgi:hypothetical protein
MPGHWITNQQVEIYMQSRQKTQTQSTACAKAGISERSGRTIESGQRVAPKSKKRHWRTRHDPLAEVWEGKLVPLLEQTPNLSAITLLEYLQSTEPEKYSDQILRTLQRRTKQWQALQGPEKEVMFRQIHRAGRQGLSDFTTLKKVTITLAGVPFKHLLYHFRLAFSHWSYMMVVQGGESFTALAEGLQNALKRLGGAPFEHRTDSLSAAFKNLNQEAQEDITSRYEALCQHYKMQATRNNRSLGHENGSVESPHGHLKRRIEQALLLRGHYDFANVQVYQAFIEDVVQHHNRRNAKSVGEERRALQTLPPHPATDYTALCVSVSRACTIDVRRVTYTVPSRLQGEVLHVHLYDACLKCYLGHVFVVELKRYYPKGMARGRVADYRHIIQSLVQKPQAFRHAVLRNEILPNQEYHTIWQALDEKYSPKEACKLIVGLLHLSATENCEQRLAQYVLTLLHENQLIVLSQLQRQFKQQRVLCPPAVEVTQHLLAHYNDYIPLHQEGTLYV